MSDFHKIGIWQTAFIGDAVLTLPLLTALKNRYPQAELHMWVRSGLEELFAGQPQLTAVHGFDKRGRDRSLLAAARLGASLRNEGFDLWISAHRSLRSAIVSRATNIPMRIGYDTPWFSRLAYTNMVDRKFREMEEIERLHQLLTPLGIGLPAPEARLVLPDYATERAERLWEERNLKGDIVLGVHPGSTWPTKCWLPEYFAEVIRSAATEGYSVLVFGGPNERKLAGDIVEKAGGSGRYVHNLAGELSLVELAGVMGRLNACLTNDSGPMHLAWTQGVPLVSMFGPTVRSLGFFPRGEKSIVMETELGCRPCGLHGPKKCPKKHHDCMKKIRPAQVWETLRSMLDVDDE